MKKPRGNPKSNNLNSENNLAIAEIASSSHLNFTDLLLKEMQRQG